MENGLNGKVVAVTGGFGSLGLATAQLLAERGARVALIGRGAAPEAAALPAELANALCMGGVDLVDAKAAQTAFGALQEKLGALDALVNVAGAFRWETVGDGDAHTWDSMFDLNVKTALNASKAALPHLVQSGAGRVVNIGAGAGLKAGLGMGAYSASKAGVARLTEALAEELKDKGVTVNAILPGIIDTPQNRADMPGADFTRWVQPREIATVIAFLLGEDAQAITGALIPVNGRM
ncbi:SDR family NAD(P)-dependent oxidoreductase [Paraburkholderia sp. CNPSo 3272]|uniref:SDR family NAD(P)-dependent oxidoreductase n=1 Tax=Paraburkholderia sp. CNPSo 3272 TaxID=2940931 RepID=UPI0020B808CF|nr:SDR family NAD(P)-dependent oxidoreductase [Paraburkholderia sp. CNPSo 3272]MCP3726697.1 SDR family NAD(P)-dependent oxidoreductase [Paraburkholderia sp. CNPSo 3272]